jgi:hypothetical protein
MSEIVDILRSLPPSEWQPLAPGDPNKLAQIEKEFEIRLPDDFRELLLYSDGGSLEGPKIEINVESMDGLVGQNYDERFIERLPGMFVIGDDGVGGVFFYDPEGRLGHGKDALYDVKLGVLGFDDAVFVAPTLMEAIKLVRGGAEFRKKSAQ